MDARKKIWSPGEIDLVMEFYEFVPTQELADLLVRARGSVYNLAHKLQLYKDPQVTAEMSRQKMMNPEHPGRPYQFPKGHVPQNKGKKMPGFTSGRMRETQFKKGQCGWNWMPVGATRKIEGYEYTKVSDKRNVAYTVNWKPSHVLLWKKKRGKITRGHVVVFKDGNHDRIRISNLELVSRAELMSRNTIHRLPPELKQVIQLKGAIRRVITCRRRNAEKQNI